MNYISRKKQTNGKYSTEDVLRVLDCIDFFCGGEMVCERTDAYSLIRFILDRNFESEMEEKNGGWIKMYNLNNPKKNKENADIFLRKLLEQKVNACEPS